MWQNVNVWAVRMRCVIFHRMGRLLHAVLFLFASVVLHRASCWSFLPLLSAKALCLLSTEPQLKIFFHASLTINSFSAERRTYLRVYKLLLLRYVFHYVIFLCSFSRHCAPLRLKCCIELEIRLKNFFFFDALSHIHVRFTAVKSTNQFQLMGHLGAVTHNIPPSPCLLKLLHRLISI